MEDWKEAIVIIIALLVVGTSAIKGCQTVYETDAKVSITAMEKGYTHATVNGSSMIVWVKKTAAEEAGLLQTTNASPAHSTANAK